MSEELHSHEASDSFGYSGDIAAEDMSPPARVTSGTVEASVKAEDDEQAK